MRTATPDPNRDDDTTRFPEKRFDVLPGTGHWVAEQAPQELLAALTAFLAPYRDGAAVAHNSGQHAAAD